jgi:glycosyltransferase involved in cell wall biosynthesis
MTLSVLAKPDLRASDKGQPHQSPSDGVGSVAVGRSLTATPACKGRILIIVENLPVPFDRRVWQEATTLQQAGYGVTVICPTGKGFEKKRETIDGVAIYRHSLPLEASGAAGYALEYSLALWWEFVNSWRVLFGPGFDVIHACNPPDTIFLIGGFFRLFFRKKFVFDHHDINPELYEAKFGRRDFFYKLMVWLERRTFRIADMSIATNESYRAIAVTRGGMAPDKVTVVRSGPKIERFPIVPAEPSLKHGRRYLVAYVGVMGPQDGLQYLLKAVAHVVGERGRDDVHFCLVGSGPMIDELHAMADELEIRPFVTFTGRIPDEELIAILNTAEVCVNPDEYNEMNDKSTMNKIMEYMAVGKPIVQFDLAEGRFSAGEASLYAERNNAADLGDKILGLLDVPEQRARMGQIGRERMLSELSWEHQAPKLLAAYDALFARS